MGTINKCNNIYKIAATFLYCIFLFNTSIAQNISAKKILIKGDEITTSNNLLDWESRSASGQVKYPLQVLIQFTVLPDNDDKEKLSSNGVSLIGYIPEKAYVAVFSRNVGIEVLRSSDVSYIQEVNSNWKLSDKLVELLSGNKKTVSIAVSFNRTVTGNEIEQKILDVKGSIIKDRIKTLGYSIVTLPKGEVKNLINWYGVQYVEVYNEDVPLNATAKAITGIRSIYKQPKFGGAGLNGDGIAIGVGDNTSGIHHIDLRDRVINYTPLGYTNHGVHINGIVGGAGIIDPKGEGMATHALLSDHYFSDVLEATPDIYKKYNVNVTNNSYSATRGSCEYAGTYDLLSAGLDNLCNDYPNVLQVFAAANDGFFDCPPYPAGFATIAGGYQVAKNTLIVTSTDKTYNNAGNASRGPVRDGRLKPEISAVGVDVNSATRSEDYLVASGTSMACPQVAAAAGLLTQRYKELNSGALPRADLLKAILINGSKDIGDKGPDFRYGFGFLDMQHSLEILDSGRYFTGVLKTGETVTQVINVPPNTAKLKVLVTWHDPSAMPFTSKQLINDLDLEVSEPGGFKHLPLVLNPDPTKINDLAIEQVDRLNNTEQVTIYNPTAGSYTITIKGFNVPVDSQRFVVTYDFEEEGVLLKYPQTGDGVMAGDTINVYWDESESSSELTLGFSSNNGSLWTVIASSIPAGQRYYSWAVPTGISSGQCKLQLIRNSNGAIAETGLFAVTPQPQPQLSNNQCPGYIQVNWPAIPNATGYEVMRKVGAHMQVVDTTADTTYIHKGLSIDNTYYVAVRPVVDGLSGYRSLAIKRKPDDGDCDGSISDGDVMISELLEPVSGRRFTSSQLTANELLKVRVLNLDNVACDSFILSYNVNNNGWLENKVVTPIQANGQRDVTLASIDMSAIGTYNIRVAITNLTFNDSVNVNDTITRNIRHIANDPVTLDFSDDFESLVDITINGDTIGLGSDFRWDYSNNTDTGRVRTNVLDDITINGNRSISMDAYKATTVTQNLFQGTFNLSGYDVGNEELRLDFDYIIHGKPKTEFGNVIWLRGQDIMGFNELYYYSFDEKTIGTVQNSGSLSLNDLLLANNDNFSSSTQIVFGQNDTSVIASRNYGNGLTFDNVRIYTVQNDIQLVKVVTPDGFACGVNSPVPLTVEIRNGVNNILNNISLNYRLDNNATVTEMISGLNGKETLQYTFTELLDITSAGAHRLDIWVNVAGDTYNGNDSILNYEIRNQPLITQFPYEEDFEQNNGYWFADGINNSWEYGTPSGLKIDDAASGTKAWVTNLFGNYRNNEKSYLYTPCFDIAHLRQPTISFKAVFDIENCGNILCDAGYIEFTTDGGNWSRLLSDVTTNWYTDTSFHVWNVEDKTIWHPVEAALPDSISNIQLRFVLNTDPGATLEGIGIDDFRLYDNILYPGSNDIISISPNPTSDGIVTIEWASNSGTEMQLSISDITGKQLLRYSTTAQQGYNKTVINTPAYSSGVYLLNMIIGGKEHTRKIVYTRR